ncbi:MAG: hypothetical protein PHU36_04055 [Syntrophomonadaceae bacterium]|nr:hypothetical protein [Syntrophomonadaceae bacterium]
MIKYYVQLIIKSMKPTIFLSGLSVIVLTFLLLMALPAGSYALGSENDSPPPRKAYIILVDKLAVEDISPELTPNIYRMVENGALGLATSRTLRGQNNMDSSLTIGSGNIARLYAKGIMAYDRDEAVTSQGKTAAEYYCSLTGYEPGNNAVLFVNLPEVVIGLSEENVSTIPGALGENLHLNDLEVAVLGNSDYDGEMLRIGAAIGMDADGQIAYGDVGQNTLTYLPRRFINQGTDYSYLQEKLAAVNPSADLIILELSDLARLEKSVMAFPTLYANEKATCLSEIDQMVGHVLNGFDPDRDLVLLFPPSASSEQLKLKNSFLPVVAYGKNISPGSLTSGSTRRNFIIASTDIAPTVLNFFGLKDQLNSMIGVPVRVSSFQGDTIDTAAGIADSASTTTRLRTILVKSYVVMQIVFILLAVFAIFWFKPLRKLAEPLVLSLVTVPLVFLFLGKIPFGQDIYYILGAIVLVTLVTILFTKIFKENMFYAFISVSSLTLLILIIDTLTGTSLIQSSVLGYDPMVGARYYGIGNEYMGIMLGSSIITAAAIFEKYSSRLVLAALTLFFLFLCFIIGNPGLGAQSDGIITAPVAFLVTLFLLSNLKMNWGLLAAVFGIVIAAAAALIGYDIHKPLELQSHLGRSFNHIVQGGSKELWTILIRKASMNIHLIRYTIWSRVFLVMFLVLSLLVFKPVGALRQLLQERPVLVKGFAGLITGAVIALVINDSGIVATSTTCIYLVIPLLLLMFEIQENKSEEEIPSVAENN